MTHVQFMETVARANALLVCEPDKMTSSEAFQTELGRS